MREIDEQMNEQIQSEIDARNEVERNNDKSYKIAQLVIVLMLIVLACIAGYLITKIS